MIESRTSGWISGRRTSFVAAAAVVILLAAMLLYSVFRKDIQSDLALGGKPAPDFSIDLFQGGTLTLSDLVGKPIVINFWASWCGPCRDEAPGLEKTWRLYKDQGVVFVGIDVRDTEADARAFLKEFGISYPNGPDSNNRIAVSYGLTGVPETVFVNREGRVVRRILGPLTEGKLREYVEEIVR